MALVPLLEDIYATGRVQTAEGEPRPAEPTGVPRAHALRLAELVRDEDLHATLETGAAFGLSALAIAGVHAARGAGAHIAIDPLAATTFEGIAAANLRRAGLDDRVRIIEERSELALPRLIEEGARLDFAFIDGMHLFDHALIDFFYVDRMLETGGYVAFHDTWMPAIQDAIDFVLANRAYERHERLDLGLSVLRKLDADTRRWDHHRPFARRRRILGSPEHEARELFTRLRDGADEAARRAGGYRDHDLVLAGRPVRMRFADRALEPAVLPAFGHATAAPGDAAPGPSLTVLLWDSGSSGLDDPEVPWDIGDVRTRGDVHGYEQSGYRISYEHASGAATVYHPESETLVFWVADPEAVPWYERGAPLRAALHHWAAAHGLHFVHAGAVGASGRGALLVGASGSGKSTTALACLEAGMEYAGDDYVILSGDETPRVHCLYSTAKLDAGSLERLPGLAGAVAQFGPDGEHKAVLDVYAHRPGVFRADLPVDAIVIPTVAPREQPEIRRATPAQALRAIAPTTLLQLPGAAQARMTAMARLVRGLPAFDLRVGTDVEAAARAVEAICADPTGAWHAAAGAG